MAEISFPIMAANDEIIYRVLSSVDHSISTTDDRDVIYYLERPSFDAWPVVLLYLVVFQMKITARKESESVFLAKRTKQNKHNRKVRYDHLCIHWLLKFDRFCTGTCRKPEAQITEARENCLSNPLNPIVGILGEVETN